MAIVTMTIRAAGNPAVHYQKGKVTTYDNGTCKHTDRCIHPWYTAWNHDVLLGLCAGCGMEMALRTCKEVLPLALPELPQKQN